MAPLVPGPGDHVLEVGCGGGLLLRDALATGAWATGIDHSTEMTRLARQRARDLEARGRARATVTRRLCTIAGFYRYAVEEELLDHSPAAHIQRPRLDYESHATGLDRNEFDALLVAAGLGPPAEHALIALLALNGLRVSEATGADIKAMGIERGHRTLVVTRKGGKVVTIPLAPRTGRHALAWVPRAVAVGGLRFSVAAADLRCDWFRMARAGVRFQVQGAAAGQQPPSRHAGMDLAGLSAADDGRRSYRLRWDGVRGSGRLWMGEVVAEPTSEHERPDDVAWFELGTVDGPAGRVVFAPPPAILVGPGAPPWPTPAESCLAWLSRQDPAPELGRSGGREVVAAVAEALVSVGAIPVQSPLLPPILGRHERSSHPDLPLTWPHPVRLGTPPDLQIALCAVLPFEHAAAVVEGLSAWGEDIQLHMYGWPWVQDQHWPAAIPSFNVRAIDDLGQDHQGHAGGWRGYGAGEGHAELTLWPAVPRRASRLRVVISTLCEARWADIELPSR